MSQIKSPACYDVSHWKIIHDFKAIHPRPYLMITKASEGVRFVDDTFVRYMVGMQEAGILRGCYHWLNCNMTGSDQARHFLRVVSGYIGLNDLLIVDVEEEGTTARQIQDWLETVRQSYPQNILMIYSRAEMLNRIPMNEGEKRYFRSIPIWTAGYPTYPDRWPSVPPDYIPDARQWGPVYLWQYSKDGVVTGITGDVDCNWVSPVLQLILGHRTRPDENPTEETMTGSELSAALQPLTDALNRIAVVLEKGGGTQPPPPGPIVIESVYQVVEKDSNPNGLVVVYKTPDVNDVNTDRFPVKPTQVVHVINSWRDVPSSLVGWSKMNDIDKQNTYLEWVCVHEGQIKNANGKWRAFPEIFLAGGSTRAEYCWMLRSCLGAKVG